MLHSGVWVRNDCPVLRIEFSAVEVGRPVSEGSVRQDGVVAGSQQGLLQQRRHASPFASGVPLSSSHFISRYIHEGHITGE